MDIKLLLLVHSFLSGVSMNPYGALSVLVKKYKLPNSIKKFIFSRSDFEIGESLISLHLIQIVERYVIMYISFFS